MDDCEFDLRDDVPQYVAPEFFDFLRSVRAVEEPDFALPWLDD